MAESRLPAAVLWRIVGFALICRFLQLQWGEFWFDWAYYTDATWYGIWTKWDATAYELIATEGYQPWSVGPDITAFISRFPPLYPGLIAALAFLTGWPPPVAGMLIASVASAVGSVFLYKWACLRTGSPRPAAWAVVFFNVFPTAFFMGMPYSEGLFACLAIVALYGLAAGRYVLGGVAAGAAVLTRMLGVALIPAFAWQAWREWRTGERAWRKLLPLAGPVIGELVLMGFHWIQFGSPFNAMHAYALPPSPMHRKWPLYDLWDDGRELWGAWMSGHLDERFFIRFGWDPLLTVLVLLVVAWRRRWLAIPETLYSVVYVAIFTSFRFNFSSVRYLIGVAPLYLVLALLHLRLRVLVLAASLVTLLYFIRLYVWTVAGF
jgi:hypothetical protein